MSLTEAQKEAYARAHTSTVSLCALELRHPSWVQPVRIVQGNEDIDITLEVGAPVDAGLTKTFTAYDFKMKEPEVTTEPDTKISIGLTGLSAQILPYLGQAGQTSTPVEVTFRWITYDVVANSVIESYLPIHLQARGFTTSRTTVTMECGYTNAANKKFPSELYTAESNPFLL